MGSNGVGGDDMGGKGEAVGDNGREGGGGDGCGDDGVGDSGGGGGRDGDGGEDGARDGDDACDDGGGETRVRWCKRAQRRSWRQQRSQKRRCQGGRRGWWLRRTLKAAEAEAVTVDTTVTMEVTMVDAYR